MNDVFDLYQELIIDHSRSPKNWGELKDKTHCAQGTNPLCGDEINLELFIQNDHIVNLSFKGEGCAIAKAAASLMTESIKGKSIHDARAMFTSFHAMLVDGNVDTKNLGKLQAFKGVRQFPIRVKCATLCWHTLNAALERQNGPVTTE